MIAANRHAELAIDNRHGRGQRRALQLGRHVIDKRGHRGAAQWTASIEQGVANMRPFGIEQSRAGSPSQAQSSAGGTSEFMFIDPYLRNAWQQRYSLSVGGGGEDLQYFVSGALEDDEGVLPNDVEQKATIRGNFTFTPADNLQLQWNTSFMNNEFPIRRKHLDARFGKRPGDRQAGGAAADYADPGAEIPGNRVRVQIQQHQLGSGSFVGVSSALPPQTPGP